MTAIIFFSLGALLGFYLLTFILQNKNTPKGVAFIHGLFVFIGLIILISYIFFLPSSIFIIGSLIAFILAGLGGITLMYRDITHRSTPKWLGIMHGLAAFIGIVLLIIGIFLNR